MSGSRTSILSTLAGMFDRRSAAQRAFPRQACQLAAQLELPDKALSIDGMILEASRGGLLFREASRYILDRRGATVVIQTSGYEFKGDIVNVSPLGYGVRLAQLMSEEMLARILARRQAA